MKISPLFRRLFIRRWLSTEAGPRPFPSPYNIGIDIAQISRYDEIVLNSQLLKYKESESPVVHTAEQPFRLDFRKDVQPLGSLEAYLRKTFNHVEWSIVRSKLLQYLNESTESWRLAKFLASRWAAKEAAIKAYSRRRLRYRDVIIASMPIHDLQKNIPVALINPPKPMIMMTDEVARNRGLVDHARKETNDPMNDHPKPRRWARTIMSERQIARLSISHDGEYAIAVVQAFDESSALPSSIPIMDKGYGDPIHEPLIGDVGYDTYDLDAAIGNSPENMSYLY